MQSITHDIRNTYPHIKAAYATHHEHLLFEFYRDDVNERTLLRLASATKSVVSTLIGVALHQGFLSHVNQSLEDLIPWEKSAKIAPEIRQMTLHHLLTMMSGIKWPPPRSQWSPQHQDIRILEELSVGEPPGNTFVYKPDVHVVACLIEEISGVSLNQFVEQYLFTPLNIQRYAWNLTFQGYEGLSLTVRDFWKLGHLYLKNGVWNGSTLLSEKYITMATSSHSTGGFPENMPYGYYWWITAIAEHHAYYAGGFGGQYLVVVPDTGMVIAILSDIDRPHLENRTLAFDYIAAYLERNRV